MAFTDPMRGSDCVESTMLTESHTAGRRQSLGTLRFFLLPLWSDANRDFTRSNLDQYRDSGESLCRKIHWDEHPFVSFAMATVLGDSWHIV